jgi:hypothetical protein
LRAVFDDAEVVVARKFEDWIHVTRPARKMHRENCLRSRREHSADSVGRDILRVSIDIRENWPRSHCDNRARRSNESSAGGNNLIAWSDIQCPQRKFKRDRPV